MRKDITNNQMRRPVALGSLTVISLLSTAYFTAPAGAQNDPRRPSAIQISGSNGAGGGFIGNEYVIREYRFGQSRDFIPLAEIRINGGRPVSEPAWRDINHRANPTNNGYYCGFVTAYPNSQTLVNVNLLSISGVIGGRPIVVDDPAKCTCMKYKAIPNFKPQNSFPFNPKPITNKLPKQPKLY